MKLHLCCDGRHTACGRWVSWHDPLAVPDVLLVSCANCRRTDEFKAAAKVASHAEAVLVNTLLHSMSACCEDCRCQPWNVEEAVRQADAVLAAGWRLQ